VPRPTTWLEFWERPTAAFRPGDRNELEARQVAKVAIDALGLEAGARLLDWGCGYALGVPVYADAGIEVLLFDRARATRQEARRRFAGRSTVLNEVGVGSIEPGTLDAIVVCSVLQYLEHDGLCELLDLAARSLKPSGALLLADVIPLRTGLAADLRAFLPRSLHPRRLARWSRDALSLLLGRDYGRLRRSRGLRRFDGNELRAMLDARGFTAERLERNIGPNQSRVTWIGRRPTRAS
jgi:cyclopropane fatty-acyl-phospholipid synthase-like methyltransferase